MQLLSSALCILVSNEHEILRNPLSVDIYKHKSEEEYKIVERIRSLKNQKKVIEIEELRELGVNTKKLALELNDLVNEVLVANA